MVASSELEDYSGFVSVCITQSSFSIFRCDFFSTL